MGNYLIYYLVLINLVSFIITGLDKFLAIKHKMRISEISLLSFSLFGGSIGEMLGMLIFHHKTKHIKFLILNPIFLLVWIIILIKFI